MDATAQIVGSLFELNRVMRHRMAKLERPTDLNMHQMHALLSIQEHPRCTMSDIARLLHITQASATPIVARLVRLGMAKRHVDRSNRKIVRVSLTPLGASELKKAMTQCHTQLRTIFSKIPAKDQRTMAAILTALLHAVHHSPSSAS